MGGDEVGLTQVESLPNSTQAQHTTSSVDKSGSLKKPTKYQKRTQKAFGTTRGKKTKGTTSGRRVSTSVLESKKNSSFKRSQVLKVNSIPKKRCVRKDAICDLVEDVSAAVAMQPYRSQ